MAAAAFGRNKGAYKKYMCVCVTLFGPLRAVRMLHPCTLRLPTRLVMRHHVHQTSTWTCRSRQDLEVAYFKEWEETTVLAEQEGRRKMTLLTMLAFLPTFIKFYVVSAVLGSGRRSRFGQRQARAEPFAAGELHVRDGQVSRLRTSGGTVAPD